MSTLSKKVVIVGGGITGLTAAYYLQKEAKEKQLPVEVLLVEASNRLGGKIQTHVQDGFVIERGPDSFLARKTSAARLVKEVGLEDKLVHNTAGKSYVLVNGKLHPMPGGSIMGIPTEMTPFALSGLFSPLGKLRAAGDLLLPRSSKKGDQSLGEFFRRRLGDEVLENLIEPLLSGIYAGDIDQLSLMSTFPQFYTVEQKYRSLILGMKNTKPKKQPSKEKNPKGMFQTVTTGLESVVTAIEEKLEPQSILKNTAVKEMTKKGSLYAIKLSNGEVVHADYVILSTPHHEVPKMLPEYSFFDPFKKVPSTSVATVAMAFDKSAVKKDINGTGFVVSRNSDYDITACTWTHKKWPLSTPDGKVLLRCYVGRAGDEGIVDQSDEEIKAIVLRDLNKTMNITAEPDFTVVTRWRNAMPQYTVGHKDRMETINKRMEEELPNVFLAGSSYEGLGIPDCIDQGEKVVSRIALDSK